MYIPIWVISLVGGYLLGIVSVVAVAFYLEHRRKKAERQIRNNLDAITKVVAEGVSDHGQN